MHYISPIFIEGKYVSVLINAPQRQNGPRHFAIAGTSNMLTWFVLQSDTLSNDISHTSLGLIKQVKFRTESSLEIICEVISMKDSDEWSNERHDIVLF